MPKWTPQSLIDGYMTITAYCHNERCHHRHALDLDALREKLGPDADAMADDLIPRLHCSKCGSKRLGLIYAPDIDRINADRQAGRNLYAKAKGG